MCTAASPVFAKAEIDYGLKSCGWGLRNPPAGCANAWAEWGTSRPTGAGDTDVRVARLAHVRGPDDRTVRPRLPILQCTTIIALRLLSLRHRQRATAKGVRATAYVQGQGEGEIKARLLLDAGVPIVLVVGHEQRFLRLPARDPALAPAAQKPRRQRSQSWQGERQKAHGSGRSGIVSPNQPSPPSPSCQLVP